MLIKALLYLFIIALQTHLMKVVWSTDICIVSTGYSSIDLVVYHCVFEINWLGQQAKKHSEIYTEFVLSEHTRPFSTRLVIMTMMPVFCSHTILQKSSKVDLSGPWEAM